MQNNIDHKTISTKAYVFFNRKNVEVTKNYLDVIRAALREVGYECEYITSLKGIAKNSLIVYAVGVDAFKCYLKGYHNMILWLQGATGDESYLKHQSKIRKSVIDFMDCFVMKKAKMIFFVSYYMRQYYQKMAHANFEEKSYVMPCFNEVLNKDIFDIKDYSKKVFTYIGSLAPWQCFDETAEIYAKIEKRIPNTFFKVLTFDTVKADEIIKGKNIKNYSVACVAKEQVKSELESATYGFIIRHDIEVNRVATPTKISSYLSAGVLPIYSPCLKDFHAKAQGKAFAYAQEPDGDINGLIQFINMGLNKEIVQQEIEELFGTYYSAENHTANIVELAKSCLK